jgi:hypothetical protein
MGLFHAVVWLDHQNARILSFDDLHIETHKVHEHRHNTAQHGSEVRDSHVFWGEVCDRLDAAGEVIVTGSHTALADFRRYVERHRPHSVARMVAYEVVDHPTDHQLVALARSHFLRHDQMTGRAPLN